MQDECSGPFRIRGREQNAHRPAFGVAEERRPLAPDGVHDRAHIVHAGLEVRQPDGSIGEARSALVEADQPGDGPEPLEESGKLGMLPVDLEM